MGKLSGQPARATLGRVASPAKDPVELRRALVKTRRQLQHEQAHRRRAESMTRAADDFLAMLAHELRQPLAAAIAAVEIQKCNPSADRQERARRVIEQQLRYIVRLVGDVTRVSEISRGEVTLQRERLDLRSLVSEAVGMTEQLFEERGHRVIFTLGEGPAWIVGDVVRLKQVFSNLLRNAALYTPPGGFVYLMLDVEDRDVRVRICDNGAGIPPDALPHIFELFNRGGRQTGGSHAGIGLAVVRRLVELHGGTVTAASDGDGRGSEFTVRLPRDRESA